MPTPQLDKSLAQEALDAYVKCGSALGAAQSLGIPRSTLEGRLQAARRYGLKPKAEPGRKPSSIIAQIEEEEVIPLRGVNLVDSSKLKGLLQRDSLPLKKIAEIFKVTEGVALDACNSLRGEGVNVHVLDGHWSIERSPGPVEHQDDLHVFESDEKGVYRFGAVSDNHLGSKYAREDVLGDLYDWFAEEGVTRVYNAGNWIDGEAQFNRFDVSVRGMSGQIRYFANNYPRREGITTYYVAGDDHEGWYAQREGMDIGRYAEQVARDEFQRNDLRYLGYMESFITLKRLGVDEATARMLVMHPGGGSAYALSYSLQKVVESLEGGEKPAVILAGHYHKLEFHNDRNVWVFQTGCTQDQTPFMRKKKLQAHIGGWLIELRQDEKGSIVEVNPRVRRYFDRGYYNDKFNLSGPIAPRGLTT